jgi:hypothetical protein
MKNQDRGKITDSPTIKKVNNKATSVFWPLNYPLYRVGGSKDEKEGAERRKIS